jgi:hypothetical protein
MKRQLSFFETCWVEDDYGKHWYFDGEKIKCYEAEREFKENCDIEGLKDNGYYCNSPEEGLILLERYGYFRNSNTKEVKP